MCFREAVAHQRCVSAKRLHIKDVFPRSGCTSKMCFREAVAHQRCVSAKRLYIKDVFPRSGCTSKMCYPFGLHIYYVLAKGLHILDVQPLPSYVREAIAPRSEASARPFQGTHQRCPISFGCTSQRFLSAKRKS
jgi:hypothetical protein